MSDADDTPEDVIRVAQDRLDILDGLVRALEDPHALLDVLVRADDVETARQALQDAFGLTEIQAMAVLDLQFRRVPVWELQKIIAHRDEVAAVVAQLTSAQPGSS
jgi:DNA gyrase subunit A